MRKVIAVDFDGTLFENAWPGIGAPRVNVIAAVLREQQNGAALILWTCRAGEALRAALRAALEACEAQGLHFDAVNDSLPEWKESFAGDPRKIGATEYWDDRAVNPDQTPGFPTGEPLTPEQLRKMDGQPVWVLDKENPQDSGWTIWAEEFNDLLSEGSYGTTWIAYAYHPAHIDMAAWGCPLCNRSRVISFKAWEDEETYQEGGPFVQGGALFCPRCGKPRTPEAQAELEKRLRG